MRFLGCVLIFCFLGLSLLANDKVIDIERYYFQFYLNAFQEAVSESKLSLAQENLRKANDFNSQYSDLYYFLAYLAELQNNIPLAIEAYMRALWFNNWINIELKKKLFQRYVPILYIQKQYQKIIQFSQYFSFFRNQKNLIFYTILSYFQSGNTDKAYQWMEQYIFYFYSELDPNLWILFAQDKKYYSQLIQNIEIYRYKINPEEKITRSFIRKFLSQIHLFSPEEQKKILETLAEYLDYPEIALHQLLAIEIQADNIEFFIQSFQTFLSQDLIDNISCLWDLFIQLKAWERQFPSDNFILMDIEYREYLAKMHGLFSLDESLDTLLIGSFVYLIGGQIKSYISIEYTDSPLYWRIDFDQEKINKLTIYRQRYKYFIDYGRYPFVSMISIEDKLASKDAQDFDKRIYYFIAQDYRLAMGDAFSDDIPSLFWPFFESYHLPLLDENKFFQYASYLDNQKNGTLQERINIYQGQPAFKESQNFDSNIFNVWSIYLDGLLSKEIVYLNNKIGFIERNYGVEKVKNVFFAKQLGHKATYSKLFTDKGEKSYWDFNEDGAVDLETIEWPFVDTNVYVKQDQQDVALFMPYVYDQ